MPQIQVTIDRRGHFRADFSGFLGSACEEEASHLETALHALGLSVEVIHRQAKSPAQTAAECDVDEVSPPSRAPAQTGGRPPGGEAP